MLNNLTKIGDNSGKKFLTATDISSELVAFLESQLLMSLQNSSGMREMLKSLCSVKAGKSGTEWPLLSNRVRGKVYCKEVYLI